MNNMKSSLSIWL